MTDVLARAKILRYFVTAFHRYCSLSLSLICTAPNFSVKVIWVLLLLLLLFVYYKYQMDCDQTKSRPREFILAVWVNTKRGGICERKKKNWKIWKITYTLVLSLFIRFLVVYINFILYFFSGLCLYFLTAL